MTRITAMQHIFASVDRGQSPTRRRGYQTLFCTRSGLTEKEVQALEDRAQYYASDTESVKRQFFWLPDGKGAITQTVPLAELDEFGRKGRYLSHSFILTLEEWKKLDFSPFDLLAAAPFLKTLDEVLGRGNLQTGDIPAVSFDVSHSWLDKALALARTWPPDQLLRLAKLAWRANSAISARLYVALIGSQEQILETLYTAFLLVPPPDRKFCSFDSHSYGCDWTRQVIFWGQGFADVSEARTSLIIDASARQVRAGSFLQIDATPYERWVEHVAIPEHLNLFLAHQDWALTLDAAIRGHLPGMETFARIDRTFVSAFAELNAGTIRKAIIGMLPSNVAPRLTRALLTELGGTPLHLLARLAWGLTVDDLTEHLYTVLSLRVAYPPSEEDLRGLASLGDSHAGLRYLLYLWSQDVRGWRQSLAEMTDQEYRQRTTNLLNRGIISAWQAIAPNHIGAWFDVCAPYLKPGEITKAADGIAECGKEQHVDRLTEIVPRLDASDQMALLKWIKTYRKKVPTLRATLEQALGRPESSFDRLKRLAFGYRSQDESANSKHRGSRQ